VQKLEGKTAVITGAASGTGRAFAERASCTACGLPTAMLTGENPPITPQRAANELRGFGD
jgi:NAD(P)-dependent dehydrogenase (short-subunit alcohol dehydrogenase family)